MEDLIVEILETLFGDVMESRRVSKTIKCIICGILGSALTALCVYFAISSSSIVCWIISGLIALMTIAAIHKTYIGK